MAYIPSAWDNPNLQHGVQSFLQSILKGVAPDFVAQQTFQQMAQQDPTLIETISNMDDGARETYSKQVLGSKNKNPLEKIGVGAKRQAREEQARAISLLTPAQLAERRAALAGTRTTTQIDREATKDKREDELYPLQLEGAKVDLKGKQQRADINDIELTEARDAHERNQRLVAALPKVEQDTIKELADSIVYRKKFTGDPQTAERVKADKIYAPILEDYIKSAQNDLEVRSRKDLQNLKGPADKQWAFQYLKDQADNAQNAVKTAQINLAKIDPNMVLTPEGQANYQQAQAAVVEAARNAEEVNNKYIKFGNEHFGLDVSSKEDRDAAEIVGAIMRGDITIEDVMAKASPSFAGKVKAAIAQSGREVPKKKPSMFDSNPNPFTSHK